MLAEGDPARMEALGLALRNAITAFLWTGDPSASGGPAWPAYDEADRRVLRFGHRITVVRDGGGRRWG